MSYVHLTPREALRAVAARIQGVFDDPMLKKIGPLTTDMRADVLYIIGRVKPTMPR